MVKQRNRNQGHALYGRIRLSKGWTAQDAICTGRTKPTMTSSLAEHIILECLMTNNLPIPPNSPRQQLLTRLLNYFRSREGESRFFSKRKLVLVLLAAAYAAFPFDLIPDFIPGLGQIDDISVIIFTFMAMFMPPIKKDGSHEDPES